MGKKLEKVYSSGDKRQVMAGWRNGSASLSGGEGCVFESRLGRPNTFFIAPRSFPLPVAGR
ncbi:hypothetical protein TMatcc_008944 [Talaromyces marneffei ATCC 18224]